MEHFIKDLGIALAESSKMGLSLPGLALAHQLYVAVKVPCCCTLPLVQPSATVPWETGRLWLGPILPSRSWS